MGLSPFPVFSPRLLLLSLKNRSKQVWEIFSISPPSLLIRLDPLDAPLLPAPGEHRSSYVSLPLEGRYKAPDEVPLGVHLHPCLPQTRCSDTKLPQRKGSIVQQLGQPRSRKPLRTSKLTAVSHRITSFLSDIYKYIRLTSKVKPFFKCEFALQWVLGLSGWNDGRHHS